MGRDKTFYHTNEKMVKDLLAITPIIETDVVLDAGSGKNKVWYHHIDVVEKHECEIEDGCDFYTWDKPVDWIIGNPPFHESWKFFDKASQISQKGIAFLVNNLALNSWTPKRFALMDNRGFELTFIQVVNDKRWFGRYYYMIFRKGYRGFIGWTCETYT